MPNFHWTPFWEDQVREMSQTKTIGEAAAHLGILTSTLWDKGLSLGITFVPPKKAMQPEADVWIAAATKQANYLKVPLNQVLGYNPSRKASRARWKAWKAVLDSDPRYSIAGLARVSGFNHSSLMYGLSRLSGMTAKEASRSKGLRRHSSIARRAREILAAE